MKKIKEKLLQLNKIEPYYFYFFLLINLIPVLSYKFFPTVDGPAHLYNSNIIVELLKNPNSFLNHFFSFNEQLNPNWSGHFLLSIFLSIFPGYIAEKIVLLIYLIGFPLSIRYLFKTIAIENKYMIYLIFPFTYSFLFYYGFYNFNIGLVFFVYGLCFWIKYKCNLNIQKIIVLTFFSTLICLSHLFIFAMFLLIIFLFFIQDFFVLKSYKQVTRNILYKQIFLQLIPLIFGLILMIKYFLFSQGVNSVSVFLPYTDIILMLKDIMPAKGINYGKAAIFTQWIFFIFIACIIYLGFIKFYNYRHQKKYILKNKIWLYLTLIILLLVFIVPDSKGSAVGFITSRLLLFFFIFLIIWLAFQNVTYWFKTIVFVIINYVNFALVLHNYRSVTKACFLANEIHSAANNIKPYSIVFPILNSDYFLYSHISNYLGSDIPLVIFENYEASMNHFPLKWNNIIIPEFRNNNLLTDTICKHLVRLFNPKEKIDYVFILDDNQQKINNSCIEKINILLKSDYDLLYKGTNGVISIFKRKTTKEY